MSALEEAGQCPPEFLERHARGDWGDVPAEDRLENEFSIMNGRRILSAYRTAKGRRIWVLTEADRQTTTILLPEEY